MEKEIRGSFPHYKNQDNIRLFTSESVTEGHPDKVCDAISDAILDALIRKETELMESGYADPETGKPANIDDMRCAVETLVTSNTVIISGEIRTVGYVDFTSIVNDTIEKIGYCDQNIGFASGNVSVMNLIHEQSPDIACGVDKSDDAKKGSEDPFDKFGAGDQGIMFGYACDETDCLMPLPITLANELAKRLAYVRKSGELEYLRPDGKTQVTVAYDDNGKPIAVTDIVVSTQHSGDAVVDGADPMMMIRNDIVSNVIEPVLANYDIDWHDARILVNPTGRFEIGGPAGDTGVTGRKIIVDTYGGAGRHGGGAMSGKDWTKVDRTAAYAARWIAKNIVASGLASRCEMQLSYAIGVAKPISMMVDSYGTGVVSDDVLSEAAMRVFDCRPAAIIEHFDMMRPIYSQLSAYGHFGRSEATWEQCDKIEEFRDMCAMIIREK